MSYEINEDLFPYSAVTFITSRWDDYIASGTGFIVGEKDVLTASHVIYDSSNGGLADEVLIYPSYDPDDFKNDFYSPVNFNYYSNFDPDGDGYIVQGDNNINSLEGTEIDIAHLTFKENLASQYGSFGIDLNFSAGEISVLGHPGKDSFNPIYDSGYVTKDLVDDFYYYEDLILTSGNSGGPIYYDHGNGPFAIGIVSTESAILSLSGQVDWLKETAEIDSLSFQRPYLSISSDVLNVDEGHSINFNVDLNDNFHNAQIEYNFSGIDDSDILVGSTNGYLEKDLTGNIAISLTIASDFKTEGPEKLILEINDATYSVIINDTSKKIDSDSVIYFNGDGINKNFLSSDTNNFFQGESYGYADFKNVGRVEEWVGTNLVYNNNFLYPVSGNLTYVSTSFVEDSSFIAASGYINISELPSDYSINNVFNNFVIAGPNQVLGSDGVDTMAAFGNGDFVNGLSGKDTFLLSSTESSYYFYNLDSTSYSGKIDKGSDIKISFENIENFKFSDKTKTFDELMEEKMISALTLSDLVSTDEANSLKNQYIKSSKQKEVFVYDEALNKINFNYIDVINNICSLSSDTFGTDTLHGFQRIKFLDSTLALDLAQGENTGVVYRLYNAAFSREPDPEGLNYHLSKIEVSDYSFQTVAKNFLNSPEFTIKNGSSLSTSEYIEILYQNILKRAPSTSEVTWYQTRLDENSISKVDVLLGFSESPENISLLSPIVDEGIWLN